MDVDEVFERFGVELENTLYLDRVFLPAHSVTPDELMNFSRRKNKKLNIIKRGKYVYVVDGAALLKKNYDDRLSKETRQLLLKARDMLDTKNAGYSGQ